MKTIANRYLSAFYCEDLRYEEGGKVTAIGIHPGGLPVKLSANGNLVFPKLCAISMFETPVSMPLNSLSIELRLNNKVLHQTNIPDAALAHPNHVEKGHTMSVELMLEFGHLSIAEEGRLHLVAIADGEEVYMSPGLQIVPEVSSIQRPKHYAL